MDLLVEVIVCTHYPEEAVCLSTEAIQVFIIFFQQAEPEEPF